MRVKEKVWGGEIGGGSSHPAEIGQAAGRVGKYQEGQSVVKML